MEFTYAEILDILSTKHNVASAKKVAFRGRLQHFQRLGFPAGANTGKGKGVAYSWRELFLIGLALDCLEIGSTPDRSVNEIVKFEDVFLSAIAGVGLGAQEEDSRDFKCFLIVELSNLMSLKEEADWSQIVKLLSHQDMMQILSSDGLDAHRSPYALIDLRQFLAAILNGVFNCLEAPKKEIIGDFKAWARQQL
ncbi:hypothetical protein [Sphingorhabdus sp. EL138]|uniref:hypothetical protein n=1 Tax=Sphingorhabdus sp. EL138 TaxID=2073156 RepID=UPI000D68875C|nr:hypothetical protein [Sphingorhabdus sp. EL138]